MDPNVRLQTNPDFVAREVAGEFILVPVGNAAVNFNGLASLNATGRCLWQMLSEPRTFSELCYAFAEEYELTQEQASADVSDFVTLALSRDLVRRV